MPCTNGAQRLNAQNIPSKGETRVHLVVAYDTANHIYLRWQFRGWVFRDLNRVGKGLGFPTNFPMHVWESLSWDTRN
jgi:hypothetical protein